VGHGKFATNEYWVMSATLATLVQRLSQTPEKHLLFQDKADLIGELNSVVSKCREIGLEVSALQVEAAIQNVLNRGQTCIQVSEMFTGLGQVIANEMSTHLFLWVPKEKSKYYDQQQLFGEPVDTNFPSGHRDIRDAGSCYALNKNTACVMHSMRVLELGLLSLANKLSVAIRKPDWENIINDIEAAIGKINGPHAGVNWKKERDFYSGAAKDFRYFKNAWRNSAMHVHEHYDEPEARLILDHVKSFMAHLAENGLKE
jgi:hypothetical protein